MECKYIPTEEYYYRNDYMKRYENAKFVYIHFTLTRKTFITRKRNRLL